MLVLGEGRSGYFLLATKYVDPDALGSQAAVQLTMCASGLVLLCYIVRHRERGLLYHAGGSVVFSVSILILGSVESSC